MKKLLLLCVVIGVVALLVTRGGSFTSEPTSKSDLTISITDGGYVDSPGEVKAVGEGKTFSLDSGSTADLRAVPVSGYYFVNWTGDDVTTVADVNAAETTITMEGDYSITANFAAQIDYTTSYTLTVATTAGGSVTKPSEATSIYYGNTVVDLLGVPKEGYVFVDWTGDDVSEVADINAAETTITMKGNYSITANFGYTLTVASSTGGSVTQPAEETTQYHQDAVVDLKGVSNDGYFFASWTGEDVSTVADIDAAETTITMSGNYSITANFVRWEVAYYDGEAHGADQAAAMTKDSQGNVYVTGWSKGSGTDYDYVTIKYDSDLKEQWVARYDGDVHGVDRAYGIAVDSSGNVYVTGESKGATIRDYATVKYNSSGAQQWVARYDGTGSGWDAAKAMVVYEDGIGNVYIYVTGDSWTANLQDYVTIKYDSAGALQWQANYNGPGNFSDYATVIAVDSNGNAYITGYSDGGSGTLSDYATVKYNSSGAQQWVARYNGNANLDDVATAMTLDSNGSVYVTGRSKNSSDEYDYATVQYSNSGAQQWVTRYDGTAGDNDTASAIAVDGSGNVYVTGSSEGDGTGYDYATIQYNNTTGSETWVKRYNGAANLGDEASAIALDSAGNIYVAGNSYVISNNCDYVTVKYNSSGNESWPEPVRYPIVGGDDVAEAITITQSGCVYVTGTSNGMGTDYDYATIRIKQ